MNYFFKFLLPQLYDYFKDETKVLEFIPQVIEQKYQNSLLEYKENERKENKNETINQWWNNKKSSRNDKPI